MKTQKQLDEIVVSSFERENGAQIYDELRQVANILNLLDVKSMLEIGCENGGSLSFWLKLWDSLEFFGIDADVYGLKTSRQERENRWRNWCSSSQNAQIIWGDSHDSETRETFSRKLSERWLSQVDFLHIDGDHSEKGTEQDYEMYKRFVRPGGLILVGDIHPYKLDDGSYRQDVMGWKWWQRFKPTPISQLKDRNPHPRKNWHVFDIYNNYGNQRSFGFGFIFV